MTDQQLSPRPDRRPRPPGGDDLRAGAAGWTGWVLFGGVLLTVVGAFSALQGVLVLLVPDAVVAVDGAVVAIDAGAWGWVHLLFGVLVCVTGLALVNGAPDWARGLGIGVTGFSMLVQMAWLPARPVSAILVIVLDVVVLYALVVTWVRPAPESLR